MKYNEGMFKENDFQGKNYIITGGGSGLGKSITQYLVQLGANAIITSRNKEKLEVAAVELMSKGKGKVIPIDCDVRDYSRVEEVVQECFQQFDSIDGLINNAAGNFISPTERLSSNAFDTIIDIVLKGTKNFTLAFGKEWIQRKQAATVVNIATTYASTGSAYVAPSACAKAGVVALTRSLAVEWAKYNIRFNAVAPGPFPTKGAWDRLLPGELREKFDLSKKVPLKRVGEHQELANLVAYLLSDYSAYINGDVITIDGGEWLKGAGQMNMLEQIPNELWDALEAMIKQKGKS